MIIGCLECLSSAGSIVDRDRQLPDLPIESAYQLGDGFESGLARLFVARQDAIANFDQAGLSHRSPKLQFPRLVELPRIGSDEVTASAFLVVLPQPHHE